MPCRLLQFEEHEISDKPRGGMVSSQSTTPPAMQCLTHAHAHAHAHALDGAVCPCQVRTFIEAELRDMTLFEHCNARSFRELVPLFELRETDETGETFILQVCTLGRATAPQRRCAPSRHFCDSSPVCDYSPAG